MYLAKEAKIVLANVPVDINNLAVTGDYVSMKGFSHCTMILQFGAVGTGTALTLKQATDVTNSLSDEKALSYDKIYINVGLSTTNLTETAVTSDTYTVGNDPNNLYVIEIDAAELDVNNDFDCVRFNLASGAGTTLLSAVYVLTGARYDQNTINAIVD